MSKNKGNSKSRKSQRARNRAPLTVPQLIGWQVLFDRHHLQYVGEVIDWRESCLRGYCEVRVSAYGLNRPVWIDQHDIRSILP